MNVPAVLQNIRSKHPVAYVVLYLFVVWVLLVIITHAIAFGAENAIYAAPRCTCPKYRCARARGSLLEQYTRLCSYSTGLKMVDWPKTLRMRALASSSVCGMLGAAP